LPPSARILFNCLKILAKFHWENEAKDRMPYELLKVHTREREDFARRNAIIAIMR
jgi:hypothetical protein